MTNRATRVVLGLALAGLLASCQVPVREGESMKKESQAPWRHETDKLVVCHYFNWFKTKEVSGSWDMWEWKGKGPNHDPETILTNGLRDIASVYYPMIGPYDSTSPEVIEYHMLTALAAKIDGFFIDWYGIPSHTEKGFPALLDRAAQYGFKMCICFEDKAMFGYNYNARTREEAVQNAITNIDYILETHAKHPAYLHIDGVPVIINFSWTEPTDSVQAQGFSAAEYERILAEVRKKHQVYFIHDYHCHVREKYWDAVDSVYPWLDANGNCLKRFYKDAKARMDEGKLGFITSLVYPGFDNTGVWGWGDGPFITPREDGVFYERSWQMALSNDVRFVQIATWNDFGEGATIEPTVEHEMTYLQITEKYAAELKGLPSSGGAGLEIPLMIYHARKLVMELGPGEASKATTLNGWLDRAIARYCEGDFDEAGTMVSFVRSELKPVVDAAPSGP